MLKIHVPDELKIFGSIAAMLFMLNNCGKDPKIDPWASKKEDCAAKGGDYYWDDEKKTCIDPVEQAKKDCANKGGDNYWDDETKSCKEKEDVRIGWSFCPTIDGNLCDGVKNSFFIVLSENYIDDIKALPTTKDIFAHVYCDDGRGPPAVRVTNLLDFLTKAEEKGVNIEPGTIYVDGFLRSDSTAIQDKFKITIASYYRDRIK